MGCRESRSAPKDDAKARRRHRKDLYSSGYSPRSTLSSTPTPVPFSPPNVLSSSFSAPSPPSVRLADNVRKDHPTKDNCSSLGGATALGSGTHTDTQHAVTAEEVLDQFRDRFIEEVDAEAVVGDLLHNNIIDEGDERDITSARNPRRQNEKLHLCLKRKCTLDALLTVCDIMTAVRGNPNMLALGEAMKRKLVTEDHREGPHTLEQQRGHAVPQAPPTPFDKLRGYYTSSPVVQNSFLVGPAMNFVKMNLIQPRQHFPKAEQDGAFASVNLCKGGVEEVPNQSTPLEYEDILNFKPHGGGSRRRVLIEGVPGSGKTTLVKRICRDWANGTFAQDSKVVIQVVLRSLPKRDDLAIEDMVLTSVGDKEEAADIAQYVRDCQGDGVVFILDGFDELPEEKRRPSIVRDILEGRLSPKASFLITSRPISAQLLYPLVDRRIEVTGFGEEEVEKYMTDYFATSDAVVGEELISTLRSRPTIRNLCFVPLLLQMVCYTVSFGKVLPRTMHELFEGLVILTVNRNFEKANRKERANSLEDVKRLCPSFMKLAQLALEGLKHDTLVFSDLPFEVDEALSGLMNCIESQNRLGGTTRTWHFLHLTLQEFLASYALSVAPEAEQIGFWSERLLFKYLEREQYILSVDRFQTMFLLYCGITGLGSKTGVQAMLVKAADAMFEPAIEDGSALSALCQAVSESGNRELACRIMSTCGSNIQVEVDGIVPVGIPWCIEVYGQHTEELYLWIRGDYTLNAADFFSQMKDLVTLTGLDLSLLLSNEPGHERDELPHLKAIAQFLKQQRTLKHLTLSYPGLCSFTKDEVSCFWSVLEHHSGSLESLGLKESEVTESCIIVILNKLPNLIALNFNFIDLPANEWVEDEFVAGAISSVVYNHPSLKELTTGTLCSPSLVNGAVGGIVRKAGVKKLDVKDDFPDHLLPQAIHSLKNQSLEVLRLGLSLKARSTVELFRALPQSRLKEFQFNSFGEQHRPLDNPPGLCQEMEKGISGCSTLTKLSLLGLPPQCASAGVWAAMALQSSLTEVEWKWCRFDGSLLKDFAVHLKHSRLRKVTFAFCPLTSVDVATLLAEGLSENRTLEQLHIKSLSSREEVVDATLLEKVETSFESNKSLQMLHIYIYHSCVLEAVLKGAGGNTSLKKLTIGRSFNLKAAAAAELQQFRPQLEMCIGC